MATEAPGTEVETAPDVLEGEYEIDAAPAPVPVNPPPMKDPMPWTGDTVWRPLVPQWVASSSEREQAARYYAQVALHAAAYHAIRLVPLYAPKTVYYAVRGVGIGAYRTYSYMVDKPTKALEVKRRDEDKVDEWLKLSGVRAERVRSRRIGIAVGLLSFAGVLVTLGVTTPLWVQLALGTVALIALAKVGEPKDKPLVGRSVVFAEAPKLTDAIVLKGLAACGINPKEVNFRNEPIQRDGPGWRVVVELPHKNTASEVVAQSEKLASGLRRKLGCVWPEPLPDGHPGELLIWVGDKDLAHSVQPPWPLQSAGKVDLFAPVKAFTDQRGRWIEIRLMFTSGVIGSIPRMGKTVTLREFLLIAALDPRCRIYAYEMKGTGDFSPLEPVAYAYGLGDEPETIERMVTELRELRKEMRRRAKVISELPRHLCPEFKVTPQLADMRHLGLFPVFLGIDECHIPFEYPELGKEIEDIVTDLVKRGPALGIMTYLATQRPDANSIPKAISDNLAVRFCLKVRTSIANNMVLGTGMSAAGYDATKFDFDKDKGIGLLDRGSTPVVARGVRDIKEADVCDRIAARARAMREAAGMLEGHCVGGQTPAGPVYHILDDLRVVYATATRLHMQNIVTRLAEMRPEVYGSWDVAMLGQAVKPYLPISVDVWDETADGTKTTKKGWYRDVVLDAVKKHRPAGIER